MVEHRRLGGAGSASVVMAGDGVEELGTCGGVELLGALLDQAQAEMDVAEQPSLFRLPERGRASELARPADVVQERGGEEQVGAQARMELGRLAGERGDADGVLEQPSGIGVVRLGGRERPQRGPELRVAREPPDDFRKAHVRDFGREELEEAVELVDVAAQRRGQARRIGVGRLDGADVELEPLTEAGDAAEDPHGVAFREAPVEQLHVVSDPSLDPPGLVDELERKVRGALLRPQPLLARYRIDAFDDAILGKLANGAHSLSLGAR